MARIRIRTRTPRLVLLSAAIALMAGGLSLSSGAFAAGAMPGPGDVTPLVESDDSGGWVLDDLPDIPRWEVTRVFEASYET
ncbi:hypothetical protein OG444_04255 [Streptomyces sp. NBC_01232]|uniref:hypothetical protein n=1 Tax=unclassified Streptomyces TaxID=2593676 RepID=UPI002E1595F5|nr:hypothetical protein OG444_04255 [Streptomyces sp. NBC_01232]